MIVGDCVIKLLKAKRVIDTILELVNNRGQVPYTEYEYNFIHNEISETIRQLHAAKEYIKK